MSTEDPYRPPSADVDDQFEVFDNGGSLEEGVAGSYDLRIASVLQEAWEKTHGLKGALWGASIVIFILLYILLTLFGFVIGISPPKELGFLDGLLYEIYSPTDFVVDTFLSAVLTPLTIGLIMLGVLRSVNMPVSFDQAFNYFRFAVPVGIASAGVTALTSFGYMILIIPGIYAAVAYSLTLPLLIDKHLTPWQAMECSRKAVTHHWFKVFSIFLIMGAIVFISSLPLLIGLIWTYPMAVALVGILYREIFGVNAVKTSTLA